MNEQPIKDTDQFFEMGKAIHCLSLELPASVWNDINEKWQSLSNKLSQPVQSGEERWISVEDRPLFTKDEKGFWTCTEDGEKEFIAAIPYYDQGLPGIKFWWIKHCVIEDETGLCVVGDVGNDPAGWETQSITHWQPLPKPPNGKQKSNAGEERLFTLAEMKNAFNTGLGYGCNGTGYGAIDYYFKEKFNIDL